MVPVLLYDTTIFILQFFYPKESFAIKLGLIFQFWLSLFTVVCYVQRMLWGPHHRVNKIAEKVDVEKQRKKLLEQEQTLKTPTCIYGLTFRAYHIETAKEMNITKDDEIEALDGSVFAFIL